MDTVQVDNKNVAFFGKSEILIDANAFNRLDDASKTVLIPIVLVVSIILSLCIRMRLLLVAKQFPAMSLNRRKFIMVGLFPLK